MAFTLDLTVLDLPMVSEALTVIGLVAMVSVVIAL